MTHIQVNKELKEELEKIKNNKSIDECINTLIKEYKQNNYNTNLKIKDNENTNIRITHNTLNKLKKLKYYPTETMNNIIFRLIHQNKKY